MTPLGKLSTQCWVTDSDSCFVLRGVANGRIDWILYTPSTPTRLNCLVESRRRRRCVGLLNSQLAHDDCRRVRSQRRHDATRLAVGKFVQTGRDCRSPTSCEFRTHRRRTSTRQLRRVGGVYWALFFADIINKLSNV